MWTTRPATLNEKMVVIQKTDAHIVPKKLLLEADPSWERVNQYLDGSLCYVAVLQEEVVGVCVLNTIGEKRYELFNIAVYPEHQKKGIGTELLEHALEDLKKLNAKSVELGTGTFGYQLTFYQRLGFRVDSIIKNHFVDNYDEPIFENGIQLKDMLRLVLKMGS